MTRRYRHWILIAHFIHSAEELGFMSTQPIAYVLLSGGIDSSTCVSEAINTVGERNVRCVSMDYGQRHIREIESAKKVATFYSNRPHETIKIASMPRTLLTDPSLDVPDISYAEIRGVSPSYVPFRNGLMLSTLAAHIAGRHFDPTKEFLPELADGPGDTRMTLKPSQKRNPDYMRDCLIYFGAHAEDAAGWAYPDCTEMFIGAMACALYIGTYHKLRLVAPFMHMQKDQIIERGIKLGTPYYMTWSCYKGGDLHCGTCATCLARKDAFKRAGVTDPTEYAA
jgi:7-cyano-7-deazaguanine synthase